MKQGHIHTEILRSKPVEVSVSTTPTTRTQGCQRRQECHHVPFSAPSLLTYQQVSSQVSKPEAPQPVLCPQVKTKPCHRGWRAAGLLLLLTLLTAGAMAGGLLGFMYSPPKVSTSSSLGYTAWEEGRKDSTCQLSHGVRCKHQP